MNLEMLVPLEMGHPTNTLEARTKIRDEVLTEMVRETAFRTTDSEDHRVITTVRADQEEAHHHQHLPVRMAQALACLSSRKGRRQVTDSARPNLEKC